MTRLVDCIIFYCVSGAKLHLIKTESTTHIVELGKSTAQQILRDNLSTKNVLICGGDGSLQEFVNGVVYEATKGTLNLEDDSTDAIKVLSALRIAPIPCGSCNG